jgi:hypothetical protein
MKLGTYFVLCVLAALSVCGLSYAASDVDDPCVRADRTGSLKDIEECTGEDEVLITESKTRRYDSAVPYVSPDACIAKNSLAEVDGCALNLYRRGDYDGAYKVWIHSATFGEWHAALYIGHMFKEGKLGADKLPMAYFWYDIAAALHAAIIKANGYRENTDAEIAARDAIAAQLDPKTLAQMQQASRDWLKAFLR